MFAGGVARVFGPCVLAAILLLGAASAGLSATDERRIALVIGNGAYDHMKKLANPPRDAALMAARLQSVGFEVDLAIDDDLLNLELRVRSFALQARSAGVALFYYAGHGIQADGRNYLVPVDARLRNVADLPSRSLPMSSVSDALDFANAKVNLIILDACRNNPLTRSLTAKNGARSVSRTRGLAAMPRASGKLVAYATAPGDVAYEGTGQENSPFTQAVADWIGEPGLEVAPMFQRVREQVMAATDGKQVPWIEEAIQGDFYFQPSPSDVEPMVAIVTPEPPAPASNGGEQHSAQSPRLSDPEPTDPIEAAWSKTTALGARDAYLRFLERYPESRFAQQAVAKLLQFASPGAPTTSAPEPTARPPAPAPKIDSDPQSAEPPLPSDPEPNDPIETAWSKTTALDTRDAYIAFLEQYPNSDFAPEAVAELLRFAGLAAPASTPQQPPSSTEPAPPSPN